MSAESRSSAGSRRFHAIAAHVVLHVVAGDEERRELGRIDDGFEELHHRVRPLAELVAVGVGHPEHLGDDREGEREREPADEIDGTAAVEIVEQVVDEVLDAGDERLDARRRERLRDQAPDPGVVGRVEVQDRPAPAAGPVDARPLEERRLRGDGRVGVHHRQGRVAQEPAHVVVAGQRPRPERALVDGRLLPQPAYCAYGSSKKPGSNGLR